MQLLAAPLFCLLAAAAEAAEARQVLAALQATPPQLVVQQQQQQQQERRTTAATADTSGTQHVPQLQAAAAAAAGAAPGAAALSAVVAAFSPMLCVPLSLGLRFSNSGIITAVALLCSAVLWPSCLNLVYLLVVCWGLACWGWGSAKTWVSAPWGVFLQGFVGLHLLLLYLAQLPLLQLPSLDLVFDIMGLYSLSVVEPPPPPPAAAAAAGFIVYPGDSSVMFAVKLAHMLCLHVLYAALGFQVGLLRQPMYQRLAAAVKEAVKPCQQQQQSNRISSSSNRVRSRRVEESLLEPLLLAGDTDVEAAEAQQQQQQQQQPLNPAATAAAARPLLPSRGSLQGLVWGVGQDWRPIQRFIDDEGLGDDCGIAEQLQQQQQQQQRVVPVAAAADCGRIGSNADDLQQQQQQRVYPATGSTYQPQPAAAAGGFIGSSSSSIPVTRWEQASVLLQVLLPFLVGCGEFLLRQLLAAPAVAGIAIAAFALVQVRRVFH
jgi:hypothetical protein